MEIGLFKEVYFNMYCPRCKYEAVDETKEPCNECLYSPVNEHSHKPVKYEEDK